MRVRFLFTVLFCPIFFLQAQQNHFIYIQGDNQQNFYIRQGAEVISSSVTGFVILSKVEPGTKSLVIGFPKNSFPEYQFTLDMRDRDRGFMLKNFGEKGWGLFDMQSLETIYGSRSEPKKEERQPAEAMSDDPFAVMLASAVDDPLIRQTSLVRQTTERMPMATAPEANTGKLTPPDQPTDKKTAIVVTPVPVTKSKSKSAVKPEKTPGQQPKTGEPLVKTAEPTTPTSEPIVKSGQTVKPTEPQVKSSGQTVTPTEPKVIKSNPPVLPPVTSLPPAVKQPVQASADSAGTSPLQRSLPADSATTENNSATVKIGLPVIEKLGEKTENGSKEIVFVDRGATPYDTIRISIDEVLPGPESANKETDKPEGTTFKDTSLKGPAAPDTAGSGNTPATAVRPVRTDCRHMASDKDMLAMRKKMVMMKDEEEMLRAAVKDLREKCYTTERVKNLSYVFVTDNGRYALFDAAYPYVYDPGNYSALERLLNDDYYIKRFRALINTP